MLGQFSGSSASEKSVQNVNGITMIEPRKPHNRQAVSSAFLCTLPDYGW